MREPEQSETARLIEEARRGDPSAGERLLESHRSRLRRMVALRMDDRLAARLDPSDVVQEALMIAAERLPDYLKRLPLPFYPWLRKIAWERLVELHRRHVRSKKRSVSREEPMPMSDRSAADLAERLAYSGSGPLRRVLRAEVIARVRAALAQLSESDREVLLLRHLEQLKLVECAAVLEISETAAKKRYLRALERLQRLLGETSSEAP